MIPLIASLHARKPYGIPSGGDHPAPRAALMAGAATAAITIAVNIVSVLLEVQLLSGPLLIATALIFLTFAPDRLEPLFPAGTPEAGD